MRITASHRGEYGEIWLSLLNKATRTQVCNLITGATRAEKIDEHGWKFGQSFDKHGRGWALNWDVYGVGRDYHSKRTLIVLQIRQYIRRRKNGFAQKRRSYFLIGRNEDNSIFAHCVPGTVVKAAIRLQRDVIKAVQDWIFYTDYKRVVRQGDIGLIPWRGKHMKDVKPVPEVLLQDSHHLTGKQILTRADGAIYVENPHLVHMNHTHPDIQETGWFRVITGRRADYWDFAPPTID